MASAPARLIARVPFVDPTWAGIVHPAPELVCLVNASAPRTQLEWAESTANPDVPWLVSSARLET